MKIRQLLKNISKSQIARRLVIVTVLFSSIITLLITTVQIYIDYWLNMQQIDGYFNLIESTYLKSLSNSIWAFDENQITTQLEGLLRIPDAEYIAITGKSSLNWSTGEIMSRFTISKKFPLIYSVKTIRQTVGELKVVFSLDAVYWRLIGKIITIIISNACKTFIVSGFILMIFHYFVTRHLERMAQFVSIIRMDLPIEKLNLKRSYKRAINPDELDQVVSAINNMMTDLQQTFQRLRESEEKYRLLVNKIPQKVFYKDKNSTYLACNENFAKDFDINPEEIVGKTEFDLYPTEIAERYCKSDQQIINSGIPEEVEEPYSIKNKEMIIHKIKTAVHDKDGSLIGILGIFHDITERKNNERELRKIRNYLDNIIDSMPSMLIGVDKGVQITQWNREAEVKTGKTAAEAKGHILSDLFPHLKKEVEKIKAAIKNREVQSAEKIVRKTGNKTEYSEILIYPLVANGVEGAVIRVDDITDRVRMEEMLIQTEKMMSVGGLAAGMAHEINNPLGAVMQGIQNLQRRLSPDFNKNIQIAEKYGIDLNNLQNYLKEREIPLFLRGILESSEKAADIIANMLRFSRKSDSHVTLVRLDELLEEIIDLAGKDYDLKKKYDFRKINIIREFESGMNPIPCLQTEIGQVILNLLRNAAQAMENNTNQKEPCIILRTKVEGKNAIIEVEDNGPGMSEDVSKRVFEPFFTTKSVGQGTGLGLSVSYMIVANNHGGSLELETAIDKGSKFIVKLPFEGN